MIVLAVVAFSVLAVGGFLLYKCVQRRNIAQNVRRQMELKSYEFMASLGGPQAFADPQMKHVIHI